MPSTVIRRFDYRPESRALLIEFTTGRRYLYLDVPDEVFKAFQSAFSKGNYFNQNIRNAFACRELERATQS